MQPSTIRTFFACEISSENLTKIDKLLADLRARLPQQVKWVDTRNMHLTVQFLGEFQKTDVAGVEKQLNQALSIMHPFSLNIQKLGAFPSPARPKVVWLGIEQQPALFRLVEIVTQTTKMLGYPPEERPFSAHITLGRVKPYASPTDLANLRNEIQSRQDVVIGSQMIASLHFIKSELTPAGPRYQELFNLPFSA